MFNDCKKVSENLKKKNIESVISTGKCFFKVKKKIVKFLNKAKKNYDDENIF